MDINFAGRPRGLSCLAVFAVTLVVTVPSYAAQEGTSVLARPAAQEGTSVLARPAAQEGTSVLARPAAQEGTSVLARPAAQEGTSVVSRPAAQEGTSRVAQRSSSVGSVAGGFGRASAQRDAACSLEEIGATSLGCP